MPGASRKGGFFVAVGPDRARGDGSIATSAAPMFRAMAAGDADPSIPGNGDPISEEEALRRLRLTDDPSAQYYAAWWLGRNRSSHPDAVPLLQEALRQRRPQIGRAHV